MTAQLKQQWFSEHKLDIPETAIKLSNMKQLAMWTNIINDTTSIT